MNVKIADVMAKRVIAAAPHHTVNHVRTMLERNRIHALPVTNPDRVPLGIITSADIARRLKDETRISRIMTREAKTIPVYNDISAAAPAMRRSKIHHLIVTHENQVVGMISSFDKLKLFENHRSTMKGSTPAKRDIE